MIRRILVIVGGFLVDRHAKQPWRQSCDGAFVSVKVRQSARVHPLRLGAATRMVRQQSEPTRGVTRRGEMDERKLAQEPVSLQLRRIPRLAKNVVRRFARAK